MGVGGKLKARDFFFLALFLESRLICVTLLFDVRRGIEGEGEVGRDAVFIRSS